MGMQKTNRKLSTWAADAEESFNYIAKELSCFYLFVGESDGVS